MVLEEYMYATFQDTTNALSLKRLSKYRRHKAVLPLPVPFTPASRPFRSGFLLFVPFLLQKYYEMLQNFSQFSRFPPPLDSHFPPSLLPPPGLSVVLMVCIAWARQILCNALKLGEMIHCESKSSIARTSSLAKNV